MLIQKQFTRAVEVPVPFYAKHKSWDWYILITENEAIEVLPWGIKTEDKSQQTWYTSKIDLAFGDEYSACTKEEFYNAYTITLDSINKRVLKAINQ